jgi:hypothetical protein
VRGGVKIVLEATYGNERKVCVSDIRIDDKVLFPGSLFEKFKNGNEKIFATFDSNCSREAPLREEKGGMRVCLKNVNLITTMEQNGEGKFEHSAPEKILAVL